MSFIRKYLLPREIDFNAALLTQANSCHLLVDTLHKASSTGDLSVLNSIPADAHIASQLKTQNMSQLLSVFIAPYDKESIFRMISQLDWISLSVKHFHLEIEAYDIHSLGDYEEILATTAEMVTALVDGVAQLPEKQLQAIHSRINRIYNEYDNVVKNCAHASAALLSLDDIKRIIRHKDMLLQLKEIARRIHISANTLEDMAIKVL